MASYYYRRSGWNRGNRYYSRNRYYKRSTTRSKSWGNMKAAKQQADQSTFTVNIPSTITTFLSDGNNFTGENVSTGKLGVYAMNIFDQLRKSDFFLNYANMYDEFKVDRVKIKLLPTTWGSSDRQPNYYKNLTVYTAWDRTGLNQSQFNLILGSDIKKINNEPNNPLNNTYIIGTREGTTNSGTNLLDKAGLYVTIGEELTTYSSAESRTVNPNTNTSIVRWLNPKTIQEKSQWLSTGCLKKWYYQYDYLRGRYYEIPVSDVNEQFYGEQDVNVSEGLVNFDDGTTVSTKQLQNVFTNVMGSDNPCSLMEDNGIKFKPTFLVGVYPEDGVSETTDLAGNTAKVPNNLIRFNVETEVVCSFRGLRKSKIVAAIENKNNQPDIEGIPVEFNVNEELTNITPKIENPLIYPDDYNFNTEFDIYTNNDETLLVQGTNDVFTTDEWGDYEDTTNYLWAPSNPQFGKYLIVSIGKCPNDPGNSNPIDPNNTPGDSNPVNSNVTPKPKLYSNTIQKLITIDDDVGKIENYNLTSNGSNITIPLPNGKKFVDDIKVNVAVNPPVIGFANINENGQYSPDMFDYTTGELLPEGTTSNNQYLDQINVNVNTKPIIYSIDYYNFNGVKKGNKLLSDLSYYQNGRYPFYSNDVHIEFCLDKSGNIQISKPSSSGTSNNTMKVLWWSFSTSIVGGGSIINKFVFKDRNENEIFGLSLDLDESNDINILYKMNNLFRLSVYNNYWV